MELVSKVVENHISGLMSSLKNMLDNEFVCDFTIKVGEKSFFVHRVILAGSSKYFKAMFSSEMKEAQEGFVQMVDMEEGALEISIEFLYTGKAVIDSDNVEDVLSDATLMQLDGLAELCFHFLENTINVHTCLRAMRLTDLYERQPLKDSAEEFLIQHFEEVISESDFPSIPKDDLTRYIAASGANHKISWKAVVCWLADDFDSKKPFFGKLIEFLKVQDYGFELFRDLLLAEPFLQNSNDLKAELVRQWICDVTIFKRHLTPEHYYSVKSLITTYAGNVGEKIAEFCRQFFVDNFKKLSKMDEFVNLEEEYVLAALEDTEHQQFPEKLKWEAAIKWVNHEKSRQKIFPTLFDSIRFHLIPKEYVQTVIRTDPLLAESHPCKDTLHEYLCSDPKPASHITILDRLRGNIMTFDPSNCETVVLDNVGLPGSIGVAVVKNDLYLVTRRSKFFRLNRDGTWTTLPQPTMRQDTTDISEASILSNAHLVYITDPSRMQWFDPFTNKGNSKYQEPLFIGGIWPIKDGTCVAASDAAVYALGCKIGSGSNSKVASMLIQRHRYCRWSKIAPMNNKRAYASAAFLNETLWVTGGGNKSVEAYHPALNVWMNVPEMVLPREKSASCVISNKLYVIGGERRTRPAIPAPSFGSHHTIVEGECIETFDQLNKNWKIVQTLKRLSSHASCCPYSPPAKVRKLNHSEPNVGFSFGPLRQVYVPVTCFSRAVPSLP